MAEKPKQNEDADVPLYAEGPLGKRINVVYDKPQKHNHYCLHDGHLSIAITGTSGCGKSTVICSILPWIANLSQVIILSIIPEEVNKAYQAIHRFCDTEGYEFGIANDPSSAIAMINTFREKKPEGTQGIVIMDDFNVQKSGKNDPFNNVNAVIAAMFRNFGYHNIFVCQASQGVPTSVRNNTNIKIIFRMNEEHAIRSARLDFLNSGVVKSRQEFDELFAIVQNNEHAFLMLDRVRSKLFICVNGPIQEVEFVGGSKDSNQVAEKIAQDQNMQKIIREYQQMAADRGPMAKIRLKRLMKDLDNYIIYFAHKEHLESQQLQEIINAKINKII